MKKRILIILVALVIGITLCSFIFVKNSQSVSDEIPDGYMAVFHGGSGEFTKSTYIYKVDNGQANYGFKYINTENHTKSWGSSEWIIEIVDKGEFDFTDGAFIVAKKHGAYDYVTEPNNEKTFSIEEYQNRFIMN